MTTFELFHHEMLFPFVVHEEALHGLRTVTATTKSKSKSKHAFTVTQQLFFADVSPV